MARRSRDRAALPVLMDKTFFCDRRGVESFRKGDGAVDRMHSGEADWLSEISYLRTEIKILGSVLAHTDLLALTFLPRQRPS